MQNISALPNASETSTQITRDFIHDPAFCQRHRASDHVFQRQRKLPFIHVIVLLLQKSVRSIQLHLHDFFAALAPEAPSAGASAWCEARLKLRHTAFIELNERAILEVAYGGQSDFVVRRWQGYRLLGIDSSLIRLPQRTALGEEFGWVRCTNPGSAARYPQARLSALTDLLNRIVLHTILVPWQQGERALALQHIPRLQPQDIALLDRGFASFELFAQFVAQQRHFVCRCPASSFSVVDQLFQDNEAGRSVVVTVRPCASQKAPLARAGLPKEITLRFVAVRLPSGELEVLATDLLDEVRYPTAAFLDLYHHRWGIETYYGLIKGRLDLGNFTGLSAEAVRQDLHATIFLSNLESILTAPVQEQLHQRTEERQHRAQVNHAVSFHALKSQIIPLLLSAQPLAEVLPKLRRLFLATPVASRPTRKVPRQKPSGWRSYFYQRNIRKSVF